MDLGAFPEKPERSVLDRLAQADDWRTPPADHITTRYETKGLGDIKPDIFWISSGFKRRET